jgi:hypothetical protein
MAENEIPFSIGIEVFARLQKLEEGLKQAESTIEKASQKIAQRAAALGKKAGKAAADGFKEGFAKMKAELEKELSDMERKFAVRAFESSVIGDRQNKARQAYAAGEQRHAQNELRMAHTPNMFGSSGSGDGGGGFDVDGVGGGMDAASRIARRLKSSMSKVLGVAAGVGIADMLLEGIIKGIKDKDTTIGMAVGDSVARAVRAVPVVGALGELASMALDPLMGGYMGMEADQQASRSKAQENMQRNAALARREQRIAERVKQSDQFVADSAQRIKGIRAEAGMMRQSDAMRHAQSRFMESDFQSEDEIQRAANDLFRRQEEMYNTQKKRAEETLALEKERIRASEKMTVDERKASIEVAEAEHMLKIENLRLQHEQEQRNLDELEQSRQDALKQRLELEAEQARQVRESFEQAQHGMAEMRQQAQLSASRQTSTFATAGGSFTTAAIAQVNELKVLRAAVEKFPVLLAQIATNTAMGGVSLR